MMAVGLVLAAFGGLIALQGALGGTGGGPLTATGAPGAAPRTVGARVWIVQPGDTLWGIAQAEGGRGDIRPLVDRLSAETGGRPLQVGQRILLP
jgi:hypothetical protein